MRFKMFNDSGSGKYTGWTTKENCMEKCAKKGESTQNFNVYCKVKKEDHKIIKHNRGSLLLT
jgi:hypothetical protein